MAPTFITKALKRVLNLAIPIASDRPSNDVVQLIAQTSNGDLRSAVNSLEMLMKTSSVALTSAASGKTALPKKGKGSRGGGKGKTSGSKEMQILYVEPGTIQRGYKLTPRDRLNQIARREQSLGLFHALGKVLYNKRKSPIPRLVRYSCSCRSTGIGETSEDDDDNALARAKEAEYLATNPLPEHLRRHSRPRYENDFEVSGVHILSAILDAVLTD
jgi:cell cycle checkpoint protein